MQGFFASGKFSGYFHELLGDVKIFQTTTQKLTPSARFDSVTGCYLSSANPGAAFGFAGSLSSFVSFDVSTALQHLRLSREAGKHTNMCLEYANLSGPMASSTNVMPK